MIKKIDLNKTSKQAFLRELNYLLDNFKPDYIIINFAKKDTSFLDIDKVITMASKISGIPVSKLLGKSRIQEISDWRSAIYIIMYIYGGLTMEKIGRIFGRTRGMVSYAIKYNSAQVKPLIEKLKLALNLK